MANFHGRVDFTYTISDGTATVAGSAVLVVASINDVPTTGHLTLPGMQEDGDPVTITREQLLAVAGAFAARH